MFNMLAKDAALAGYVEEQLRFIEAQVYATPRPPLKAEVLIPHDLNTVPRWAQQWGFDRIESSGRARWMHDRATDIPTIAQRVARHLRQINDFWTSYDYSWREVETGRALGRNLDASKGADARRVIEEFREQVLLYGDSFVGYTGFANDPVIPVMTPLVGGWDGSGSATPEQIIEAINHAVQSIERNSLETFYASTIAVDLDVYRYLTTQPIGFGQTTSIWKALMANTQRPIELVTWQGLATAGAGGTRRAVIYDKRPEVIVAHVPIPFEIGQATYPKPLTTLIPAISSVAGTFWRTPVAATFVDGI